MTIEVGLKIDPADEDEEIKMMLEFALFLAEGELLNPIHELCPTERPSKRWSRISQSLTSQVDP